MTASIPRLRVATEHGSRMRNVLEQQLSGEVPDALFEAKECLERSINLVDAYIGELQGGEPA